MILLLLVAAVAEGWAQNNPFKIRDELYPIYQRAFYARRTPSGLLIADTLYREATRLGDNKAKCLAQNVRFVYAFYNTKSLAEINAALKPLQDDALKYGYLQYYYVGVSNKVYFMLDKHLLVEALDYINEQFEFAKKHNHHVGVYNAYLQLSEYYKATGEMGRSKAALQDAINYGERYLPNADRSSTYRKMAERQELDGEYEEELVTVGKGLSYSKTAQTHINLMMRKAFASFMLGRDKAFDECYQWLSKHRSKQGTHIYTGDVIIDAMAKATAQKYDEAIAMLKDTLIGKYSHTSDVIVEVYRRQGRYEEALAEQRRKWKMLKELEGKQMNSRLLVMEAKFNNQQLAADKREADLRSTQLKLDNSRLQLENSNLELNRLRAADRLTKLNADNIALSYDNKKLEAQKLRDSITMVRTAQQSEQTESRRQRDVLLVMLAAALVVIAVVCLYYTYRLRMSRTIRNANIQLRRNNNELQLAKAKAESADQMKTMFIQNMSHEVRTPLNAVVGFSQVLTEMGAELTEEERQDMSHRIAENASLLTTLINDILDMTNIESGRYEMKMAQHPLNDLCRMALATVEHRKADDVTLLMQTNVDDAFLVTTDGERVKQVLINLLTNAEKNTEHGTITLQCAVNASTNQVAFSVTDTGVGIPEDKMDAIFERFTKLDSFKQGAGLGLNICSIIAQKLHGAITIDRNYHQGARFFFTIPIAPEES